MLLVSYKWAPSGLIQASPSLQRAVVLAMRHLDLTLPTLLTTHSTKTVLGWSLGLANGACSKYSINNDKAINKELKFN